MDSQTRGHVVVGAIVSSVFVAYSGGPFVGGALAGYLEGSDLRLGIRVGAMAGIVVLVASMVLAVGDILLGVEPYGVKDIIGGAIYGTLSREIVSLVVLPLVGGGVGAYVRRETEE